MESRYGTYKTIAKRMSRTIWKIEAKDGKNSKNIYLITTNLCAHTEEMFATKMKKPHRMHALNHSFQMKTLNFLYYQQLTINEDNKIYFNYVKYEEAFGVVIFHFIFFGVRILPPSHLVHLPDFI